MTTGTIFFWIAVILILARMGTFIERVGQPAVMGELLVGIALGNLPLLGLDIIESLRHDAVFFFLAQLGIVILLFEVGLESRIEEMRRLGFRVFVVAVTGVALPFILGAVAIPQVLVPGLPLEGRLFLGAMLTATSVGVTARVFRDLGKLKSPEARMVLGAAILDDILGLVILAVIKAIVESGSVSVSAIAWISGKALFFLGSAILLGQLLAKRMGRVLSLIQPGIGMKFILAIGFCLIFAGVAEQVGLAPIVGAFAAGLILEPVHFTHFDDPEIVRDVGNTINDAYPEIQYTVIQVLEEHADIHVQTLVRPIGYFLIPLFFVQTGMEVRLDLFCNPEILLLAMGITTVAFIGKIAAGLFAGPVRQSVVGWGLVPRGEVTLIFAATGKTLGVLSDALFTAVIIMVITSTVLVPPVLNVLIKRASR